MSELNHFEGISSITLEEYLESYKSQIIPDSEKLFVTDFLFPILGEDKMQYVIPQYPFIDSEGRCRQIDFALIYDDYRVAFEVNGETYHGEGIIPSEQFDDNLFRQNEILFHGWTLRRYSYNQLLSPIWRPRVQAEIKLTLNKYAPSIIGSPKITPNIIQAEVLPQLKAKRELGWNKGLCIMPVGTGKTYTAALDSFDYHTNHPNSRALFLVHKLPILAQARESFANVWSNKKFGILTGESKEHVHDCDILFASKDSLYRDETLQSFSQDEFDYIIVDEVHHGEAPTYRKILDYFTPQFLLGMTATPERADRKDILALFDYRKVCEYDLNDAIDKGFLVSYEYHGLTDNIDYTKIRHNGIKYNEKDLERHLIIEKRNKAIFDNYMKFCNGDKALGFCVSIKHANAMAAYFNAHGISSVAITSGEEAGDKAERNQKIDDFRNNKYAVAFTVDMFNEGVDIPNIRAVLFLRPTESKTIFIQQLGRGLRLSSNKDQVIVLDFISNYKRANLVRQYLAKKVSEKTKPGTGAYDKMIYEYNPKCSVEFDDEVQAILDLQDEENHDINEDDLITAYYDVQTQIMRKPTPDDINQYGKYRVGKYVAVFGSWIKFLRAINEITENGYHYPQGLHFGHILYILQTLHNGTIKGSNIDEKYVRLRGDLDKDDGDLAAFQRQTKYKIQGMMGMGLLEDDRKLTDGAKSLELTESGEKLYSILKPVIDRADFSFKEKDKGMSWEMTSSAESFVNSIRDFLNESPTAMKNYLKIILQMDAVPQALSYCYQDCRAAEVTKAAFYKNMFETERVVHYCEMNGIEIPSEEGRKHRAPFIVSILETLSAVETTRSSVVIKKLLLTKSLFESDVDMTYSKLSSAIISKNTAGLSEDEIEKCKEIFGPDIFTDKYHISIREKAEE